MITAVIPRRLPRRRRSAQALRRDRPVNLVGLAVFVVMVFPVYWMVSTAFKPDDEISSYTPKWIPDNPTLHHFPDAINTPVLLDARQEQPHHRRSWSALSVVLAFLAAVALAKYRFTGRKRSSCS